MITYILVGACIAIVSFFLGVCCAIASFKMGDKYGD